MILPIIAVILVSLFLISFAFGEEAARTSAQVLIGIVLVVALAVGYLLATGK